jgi:hypothetical protein
MFLRRHSNLMIHSNYSHLFAGFLKPTVEMCGRQRVAKWRDPLIEPQGKQTP